MGGRVTKLDRCCTTPHIVGKWYGVDGVMFLACDECGAQLATVTWEGPYLEEEG